MDEGAENRWTNRNRAGDERSPLCTDIIVLRPIYPDLSKKLAYPRNILIHTQASQTRAGDLPRPISSKMIQNTRFVDINTFFG